MHAATDKSTLRIRFSRPPGVTSVADEDWPRARRSPPPPFWGRGGTPSGGAGRRSRRELAKARASPIPFALVRELTLFFMQSQSFIYANLASASNVLLSDKENRGNRFEGKRVLDARKAQEPRGEFGGGRGGGRDGGERGPRRVS